MKATWRALSWIVVPLPTLALAIATMTACGDDEPPPAAPAVDAGVDAAPPPKREAGGGFVPIEVDCPVGTAVELESNDTPDTANAFEELSFCGALSPAGDVDYSTFKTPDGKKLALFQGIIDGKVDFELVVNGKTLRPTDVKKFEAGEYVIKAFTTDGQPGKYRYRIQFEP